MLPKQLRALVSLIFSKVRRTVLLRSPASTVATPLKVAGSTSPGPRTMSCFCTGPSKRIRTKSRSRLLSLARTIDVPCPAEPSSLPPGPMLPAVISQSEGMRQTARYSTPQDFSLKDQIPSPGLSLIDPIDARYVLEWAGGV